MKIVIIEKDNKTPFQGMPLSYRVAIRVCSGYIELTREFFRTGFSDGEHFDCFYFDNEWGGRQRDPLCRCTFITRKIDDKEYLEQKENELIYKFYNKCIESKNKLDRQLKQVTKQMILQMNNYDDMIKHYSYLDRNKKIKKLLEK